MFLLKDMEPHVAWELSLTQISVFPKERAESRSTVQGASSGLLPPGFDFPHHQHKGAQKLTLIIVGH